jgi:hypothetical protein
MKSLIVSKVESQAALPIVGVLATVDDCAAQPGPCRKPTHALYVGTGKEW